MEFKKMSVKDAVTLRKILSTDKEYSCESTFINLLVWQNVYSNAFALENGQLFIKSSSKNSDVFRLPMGGDLSEGIQKITQYLGGKNPVFWAQEGELLNEFRRLFSDKYDLEEHRDAFDYIYRRDALATLSGKKYHSKRNHIASFSKKHEWRYEPITKDNITAVKKCAECWYSENADRLDRYLLGEKRGVELLLADMEALGAIGGAIFIDEKVVAFTVGSPINSSVFDIHIEKALSDYATAYTVINREFAKRLPENIVYINREDDMGLEGLRRAKLSYKPEILLKKYYCVPKENTI